MGSSVVANFDKETRETLEAAAERSGLPEQEIVDSLIVQYCDLGPVNEHPHSNEGIQVEEMPRKGRRKLAFNISEEAHQRLRAERRRTGEAMAAIIRGLVREHLGPNPILPNGNSSPNQDGAEHTAGLMLEHPRPHVGGGRQ